MKCSHCGRENALSAHYCGACGTKFTEEERGAAYDKTLFGKLDKVLDMKGWLDLSKITGNRFVRLAVLLVLLVLVAVNISRNGSHLTIAPGEGYTVAYNSETEEYYALTDLSKVELSTYLPKKTDSIIVTCYIRGAEAYTRQEEPGTAVELPRLEDGYYVIRANYADGKSEELLLFVCEGDAV